ncbi:VanZ family protein [Georgenia alba]|uniref:VanZ family protein n=1 Tax=Georgenia alba TaxID=2233858 RepID=A0ABW2QA43_9MICO
MTRRVAWSAALVLALAIQLLVLYLPQTPDAPGVTVPGLDKAVHLMVFGAVTLAGLLAGLPRVVVVGYGVAHAVVSELVQHLLLADRSGDVLDVLADLVGVAAAVWVVTARERRDQVSESP